MLGACCYSNVLQTLVIPPSIKFIDGYFCSNSKALKTVIILQCKNNVNINFGHTFEGTEFQNSPDSIIHYTSKCIEQIPTCNLKQKLIQIIFCFIYIFIII